MPVSNLPPDKPASTAEVLVKHISLDSLAAIERELPLWGR